MANQLSLKTLAIIATMTSLETGCQSMFRPAVNAKSPAAGTPMSREELQDALNQVEDDIEAIIRRAADELVEKVPARGMKRLVLIWQMQVFPKARNALDQSNPLAGLMDLWTLSLRMHEFLETGNGRQLFGEGQEIAIRAAKLCESRVERVAVSVMPPAQLDSARSKVVELARRYPMHGEFSGAEVHVTLEAGSQDRMLLDILAIPLAPFRAFEGVDKTAESIREFTRVAARLTDVVQGLAADARLQIQLLLLETEDLDTVREGLASFQQLAESSQRLAAVAEKLPNELRVELTQAVDELDGKTEGINKTLIELRATLQESDRAGTSIAKAGDALAKTANAIEQMVASFRTDQPETDSSKSISPAVSPSSPPRPYDIQDYTQAAVAFGAAAKELRGLADEIRSLTATNELGPRLDTIESRMQSLLADGQSTSQHLINYFVLRLALLAFAIFILTALYRIMVARLPTRK